MSPNTSLEQFHDKYKDQRCFIVCPGPTLKQMNLERLKDEVTIGVNSVYLACKPLDFHLDYTVSTEGTKPERIHEIINTPGLTAFFTEGAATYCDEHKPMGMNPYFVMPDRKPIATDSEEDQHFSMDITQGTFIIISVVFQAVQLAFYMGFKEVYLIGFDCQCIDGHYYFDDDLYIGKHNDDAYHEIFPQLSHELPMHPGWMNYYMKIYRIIFERHGRRLFNCSPNSQIIALEKQKLEEMQ